MNVCVGEINAAFNWVVKIAYKDIALFKKL